MGNVSKFDQNPKLFVSFNKKEYKRRSSLKSQPFFLYGIIARGNVYMDYGHEDGLKWAM